MSEQGLLLDELAEAALILWSSKRFSTAEIAGLIGCREDAVWRTINVATEWAALDADKARMRTN